ncbi:MAG: glycosyltransferase family 2 protein [Halobacteriales archaeon]
MVDRDAVSILLPTVEWTDPCDQMAAQLRADDELFVICDATDDPVAGHDPPDGVEILVAGEPEGCSGKANAMAYGMERATNDRFVWTDADFERDKDWLDRLVAAGEKHGPATAVPFWYGNGAWLLIEPWAMMFSTLLIYFGIGSTGNIGWGGGLTFTREELNITVDELVAELRQVLSDDGLLSQHIDDFHAVRSMVMSVEVPGDLASTYARLVRFNRLTHIHEGMVGDFVVSIIATVAAIMFPVFVAPAVTLVTGAAYVVLGLRRATFLLSFLGLFFVPLTILAGMFISEFEWAGRRYRLNGKYDVDVIQ